MSLFCMTPYYSVLNFKSISFEKDFPYSVEKPNGWADCWDLVRQSSVVSVRGEAERQVGSWARRKAGKGKGF